MPTQTLQADQATVGGGDAPTTVVNVAQGSNMTVIAGVAGAGKLLPLHFNSADTICLHGTQLDFRFYQLHSFSTCERGWPRTWVVMSKCSSDGH